MVGVKSAIKKELTMAIVTLSLPDVKRKTETRPKKCQYCQGETFQRWGKVPKPVRDNRCRSVQVYRYRCCHCHRTFRHYPEGVDQADQTERMRKLVAILWVLGMSLRSVSLALSVFNVSVSHMTVWRDLQAQAELLKKRRRWQGVRVLGVDGAYPLLKGKKQPVVVAIDLGTGQPVAVAQIDEANPAALRRFLEPLVQRVGVSVIVSDDLNSYRKVAEKLGVEQQVCQFHVRRWVGQALRELKQTLPQEWLWVLDEVKELLSELPLEGSRRLFELWKQIPEKQTGQGGERSPLAQLRHLLIRMSEHWASYRVFDWQKDVPWTNNGTEQAIGRMKMRSRTVRGYKSWQGMEAALLLTGSGLAW
jgi:transposase-like protein